MQVKASLRFQIHYVNIVLQISLLPFSPGVHIKTSVSEGKGNLLEY